MYFADEQIELGNQEKQDEEEWEVEVPLEEKSEYIVHWAEEVVS